MDRTSTLEKIRAATDHLAARRTWTDQLLSQVLAIQQADGKDLRNEIRQLEVMIRKEMNDPTTVLSLHELITSYAQKLNERIRVIHGPLSDNDLFLCACTQLGISIPDIAHIRKVDGSSVVMSRYRLKKKLGLSPGDDFDSYVSGL